MYKPSQWPFVVALALTAAATAQAQSFPAKPIRIITSGVGGAGDVASRLVAQGIAPALGQQVIVDNRASGPIPVEVTLKSPADGYTLMLYGSTVWLGLICVPTRPIRCAISRRSRWPPRRPTFWSCIRRYP